MELSGAFLANPTAIIIFKINKSARDNEGKTPMESAKIKATRSPVEKAGTLCPDSTRCTSQYIHCTEEET